MLKCLVSVAACEGASVCHDAEFEFDVTSDNLDLLSELYMFVSLMILDNFKGKIRFYIFIYVSAFQHIFQ